MAKWLCDVYICFKTKFPSYISLKNLLGIIVTTIQEGFEFESHMWCLLCPPHVRVMLDGLLTSLGCSLSPEKQIKEMREPNQHPSSLAERTPYSNEEQGAPLVRMYQRLPALVNKCTWPDSRSIGIRFAAKCKTTRQQHVIDI